MNSLAGTPLLSEKQVGNNLSRLAIVSFFSLSTTYPYQATRDAPILVYLGQFKMPFKKRKKGNGSTKILIGDSLPRIVQFFSTHLFKMWQPGL